MWIRCLIFLLLIIFATGCSSQPKRRMIPRPTEIANLRVSFEGDIYVNQKVVTLDELNGELGRLKQINGAVRFFDQSAFGPSRSQGQTVRKAISEAGLLIRVE
jgi:hypothetical protein